MYIRTMGRDLVEWGAAAADSATGEKDIESFRDYYARLANTQRRDVVERLRAAVKDKDEDDADEARGFYRLLAATDDDGALDFLFEVVGSDTELAWEATGALAYCRLDRATQKLLALLPHEELATFARSALDKTRPASIVPQLIEWVSGRRIPNELELLAACARGSEHVEAAVHAIAAFLDSEHQPAQVSGYDALRTLGADCARVPEVVDRLKAEADGADLWRAIHALGVLARIEGLDTGAGRTRAARVIDFLTHESTNVRNSALLTLQHLMPDVDASLIEGLRRADDRLRSKLIEAIPLIVSRQHPASAALTAALNLTRIQG